MLISLNSNVQLSFTIQPLSPANCISLHLTGNAKKSNIMPASDSGSPVQYADWVKRFRPRAVKYEIHDQSQELPVSASSS